MCMFKNSVKAIAGLAFLASIPIGIIRYREHQEAQDVQAKQHMDSSLVPAPVDASFRLVDVVGSNALISNSMGTWHVREGDPLPDGSTVRSIKDKSLTASDGHTYEVTR